VAGEAVPVEVQRNATASGSEWFLTVGGERVELNRHGVGIFTDPHVTAAEVLPRLLVAAARKGTD
jgi:hypothetical protein